MSGAGVIAFGLMLGLSWLGFGGESAGAVGDGLVGDPASRLPMLAAYWVGHALVMVPLTVVAFQLVRRSREVAPQGEDDFDDDDEALGELAELTESAARAAGRFRRAAAVILIVGLFARLAAAWSPSPFLSDDVYRYVLDGGVLLDGGNPYAASPAELLEQSAGPFESDGGQEAAPLATRVNHPQLVTIYQPTSQWTFATLAMAQRVVGPWIGDDAAGGQRVFRMGLCLFDMAAVALLLAMLRQGGWSPWWATLYAWHPMAVAEVGWSGHQDAIGLAWMLACCWAVWVGASRRSAGWVSPARSALAGMAWAAACAVKPLVIPLAVPLAMRLRRQPRELAIGAVVGGMVLLLLYASFAVMPGGMSRMVETLQTFAGGWRFNGSVHRLLVAGGMSPALARWLLGGVMVLVLFAAVWRGLDLVRVVVVFFLAAILLTTTVYPWYLLWALVLMPVRFSWAIWAASLMLPLSYEVLLHPNQWDTPAWLGWVIYLPVFAAALWEWMHRRRPTVSDRVDVHVVGADER